MKIKNLLSRSSHPAPPAAVSAPVEIPVPAIPSPPVSDTDAYRFLLGAGTEEVVWDSEAAPHLLIAGPQGSGKTQMQRMIIDHCLQYSERWRVYGIDLTKTALSPYVEYGSPVEHIAHSVPEGIRDLRLLHDEMMRRLLKMDAKGLADYRELDRSLPALMVVIDETYHILPAIMTPAQRASETNFDVRVEALNILKELTRHGARAGLHVVMATRSPGYGITEDLWKNFTFRVVTGASNREASKLVLGNEVATNLGAGESYAQHGETGLVFSIVPPQN
ncbi:MAG: hypothetical protein H9W81_07790 [Enterococcus sp.]|nr:hypothetical protein [Enterococcus sp.]